MDGRQVFFACHPRFVPAESDVLFRNDGDGRFTDVSAEAGFDADEARQGLGIVAADLDDDNDVDLYIANDTEPNQLWVNDGTGHFVEEGFLSGLAVNLRGEREAGMGLAVGDADGDGRLDVFVTNYFSETNTFYRNEGQLMFLDVTEEIGLAAPSRLRLAFGASLIDVDNNGWLDLFIANGHVNDQMHLLGRTEEPFAQLPQLFANRGNGQFVDVSEDAGPYFQRPVVGRSSCVADFDRDGRADLAVGHLNQPLGLLHNETPSTGTALMVELIGTSCNRDALAAVVEVKSGERQELRVRMGSSSYLGCDEGRLLIGLDETQHADRVVVRWPGGQAEVWHDLAAGWVHRLVEGTGQPDE